MAGSAVEESSALKAASIVLVGAGKMGAAMLRGWLDLDIEPVRLVVLEPMPSRDVLELASRGVTLNPVAPVPDPAIVVLAVKPQVAGGVVPRLASWVSARTVVLSIMAGRSLAGIGQMLPKGAGVVRAMPNLPASIGRGITVAVPNAAVMDHQRALVDRLLTALGLVEWIDDESLLDAVTALSGSGPAYVFLLAEALAQAGEAAGLPSSLAERLARATVAGSGALLDRSMLAAATLRENVTSPGGTTAAGLAVLMSPEGLGALVQRAVVAAAKRSRELAT
jgi:pyrroline-5-carboxylate reductase